MMARRGCERGSRRYIFLKISSRATSMNRILLVRHGHVAGICPPRFRGRAELLLTERGHQQAHQVAERIASGWTPHAIYTSPLRRCVDTAAAIGHECGLKITQIEELNDFDYGAWQGKSWDEAQASDARVFDTWRRFPDEIIFPGGESLYDVAARANRAVRRVYENHADQTVVMVSHDSVNRVLLLLTLVLPLSAYWRLVQDPCCINEIERDVDGIRVRRINETAHILD
jgi:broad specificity phosphatase PhoE